LGCLSPNIEPKATEHIAEMIELIKLLLDQEIAYISNQHVYFDVTKAENYTKLSGRSLDEMLSGTRVDIDTNKKHQADFVLWKPADENDDSSAKFDSPFGVGRPGWHIECSAMSNKYLGHSFDIHGGGVDLVFPHHTNEIAQSTCAYPGSKFAKFWIHNGFLTVNSEKMSKSLGNFVTVKDLITREIKGDSARLFLLNSHYRKPLDYNNKAIKDAHKMISYWYRAIENLPTLEVVKDLENLPTDFASALLDDLNTHKAIKLINDYAKEVYLTNEIVVAQKMYSCANFLGLMSKTVNSWFKGDVNIKKIEELVEQRSLAKKAKNWVMADKIRGNLSDMGVVLEDKSDGSTVWKKQ
jgi:cysteinyl-tRNA synthetase